MAPSKVVWLEYESFKIGNITVPKVKYWSQSQVNLNHWYLQKLSNKMVESDRVHIEASLDDRVAYILQVHTNYTKKEGDKVEKPPQKG